MLSLSFYLFFGIVHFDASYELFEPTHVFVLYCYYYNWKLAKLY